MSDRTSVRSFRSARSNRKSSIRRSYINEKLSGILENVQPDLFDTFLPYCCHENGSTVSPKVLVITEKNYRFELGFTNLNNERQSQIMDSYVDYNVIAISSSGQNKKSILIKIVIMSVDTDQGFMLALNKSLEYQRDVECLKFIDCYMKNNDIDNIKKILQANPQLKELYIERIVKPIKNFNILLQNTSLHFLSLKFCQLTDKDIQDIANELNVIQSSLQILNLSSNLITDIGVSYLVTALRLNRSLVSLNLSNNYLTDESCKYFSNVLMQFELTTEEIKIKRKEVLEHLKIKKKLCEEQTMIKTQKVRSPRNKGVTKESDSKCDPGILNITHPFVKDFKSTDGVAYCKGNLYLSHLNLAYNNITMVGISKLIKILEYQVQKMNEMDNLGLTRIIIEDNKLVSELSMEYEKIRELIEIKINK